MKTMLVLCLSLLGVSAAHATGNLPSGIVCASNARATAPRVFTITGLNTAEPEISIPDAASVDVETTPTLLSLMFSNGCDNGYYLTFYRDDLEELAAGERTLVQGLIRYHDPLDEQDPIDETIAVQCRAR